MKRLIILVLWVVCMLALLVGCSSQENEIGDIDNHTPIALLDDAVVYNYIDDDGALVIGRYVLSSKRQSDIVSVEEFYISSGKPTVIDTMSLNLPNFCLVNRNIVFDKGRNSNVKFIHQKPKVFVGNCRYNK